ncbi:hypothetical protein [Ktedonospora formicarum]|uniref:Uncharacterized protein n=1 Tax=Ktedonospora formicarum TaxID=2778364 RepID=A0A8J3MTC8_9CHLR|nr:hypothetical protein [Ktedonospora formicarum]GHO47005.1 hypothetical protein KSX_51680 [Ktedonospora formicarum]
MSPKWGRIKEGLERAVGWPTFSLGMGLAVWALMSSLPATDKNFSIAAAMLAGFAAPITWVAQRADDPSGNWRKRRGLYMSLTLLPLMLGISYAVGTFTARSYEEGGLHNLVQFSSVSSVYTALTEVVFVLLATGGLAVSTSGTPELTEADGTLDLTKDDQKVGGTPEPTEADRKAWRRAVWATTAFLVVSYGVIFEIWYNHYRISQAWATIILVVQMMAHFMQLALVISFWRVRPSSWRNLTRQEMWKSWRAWQASGPDTWASVRDAGLTALIFRLGAISVGLLATGSGGVFLVELTGNLLFLPLPYVVSRSGASESPVEMLRRATRRLRGRYAKG